MMAKAITELALTYGDAVMPLGFRRVTRKDGGIAELTGKTSGSHTFLWYACGGSAPPVTKIAICYDDEEVPADFERIPRDIGSRTFLCIRRADRAVAVDAAEGIQAPIEHLIVTYGDEEGLDDGHEPLARSLVPEGPAIRLWARRSAQQRAAAFSVRAIQEGDWVDAFHQEHGWVASQVAAVADDGSSVTLRFYGWPGAGLETVVSNADVIAPLARHICSWPSGPSCHAVAAASTAPEAAAASRTPMVSVEAIESMCALAREVAATAMQTAQPQPLLSPRAAGLGEALRLFLQCCLSASGGSPAGDQVELAAGRYVRLMNEMLALLLWRPARLPPWAMRSLMHLGGAGRRPLYAAKDACVTALKPAELDTSLALLPLLAAAQCEARGSSSFPPAAATPAAAASAAGAAAVASKGAIDDLGWPGCRSAPFVVAVPSIPPRATGPVAAAALANVSLGPSPWHAADVEHFGRAGGFVAILGRLRRGSSKEESSRDPIPLPELSAILALLQGMARVLTREFAESYGACVRELVLARLACLADDELKQVEAGGIVREGALPQLLQELESALPALLGRHYDPSGTADAFHLSVALQMLQRPSFGLRVRGMGILVEAVDSVARASAPQATLGFLRTVGAGGGSMGRWSDPQRLADWAVRNDVVGLLLGATGPPPRPPRASAGSGPSVSPLSEVPKAAGPQPPMQPEVLKRSDGLLCFLAGRGLLLRRHLEALWRLAEGEGRDGTYAPVVYKLVGRLVPRLAPDGVAVVYDKLRMLPPAYGLKEVALIRDFARGTLAPARALAAGPSGAGDGFGSPRMGTGSPRVTPATNSPRLAAAAAAASVSIFGSGLELLWEAMQDDAPVSADVADACSSALAELLAAPNNVQRQVGGGGNGGSPASGGSLREQQVGFLLNMCAENVSRGHSVVPTLRLVQKVLDGQPDGLIQAEGGGRRSNGGRGGGAHRDRLLIGLEKRSEIMQLTVTNLLRYRETVAEALAASGREAEATLLRESGGLLNAIVVGRFRHSEAVGARLSFLRFFAEYSPAQLTFEHLKQLWYGFIVEPGPLCAGESEIFLTWLRQIAPEPGAASYSNRPAHYMAISEETAVNVFSQLICEEGPPRAAPEPPPARSPAQVHAEPTPPSRREPRVPTGGGEAALASDNAPQGVLRTSKPPPPPRPPVALQAPPLSGAAVRLWESLGEEGYSCVEWYFRFVNWHIGSLGSPEHKLYILVHDFPGLRGLAALWEALWRSRSERVGSLVADFLVTLHTRLKVGPELDRRAIWLRLTARCMAAASKQVDAAGESGGRRGGEEAGEAERGIIALSRAMMLLSRFLDSVGSVGASTTSHSIKGAMPPEISAPGFPATGARQVREWYLTEGRTQAQDILCRVDHYLELLFRVVELGGALPQVRLDAWNILASLPANERLQAEVKSLGSRIEFVAAVAAGEGAIIKTLSVDPLALEVGALRLCETTARGCLIRGGGRVEHPVAWEVLLENSSQPRLLYRLKMLHELLEPLPKASSALPATAAMKEMLKTAANAREALLMDGGLQQLLQMVCGGALRVDFADDLQASCAAALLHLVRILTLPGGSATKTAAATATSPTDSSGGNGAASPQAVVLSQDALNRLDEDRLVPERLPAEPHPEQQSAGPVRKSSLKLPTVPAKEEVPPEARAVSAQELAEWCPKVDFKRLTERLLEAMHAAAQSSAAPHAEKAAPHLDAAFVARVDTGEAAGNPAPSSKPKMAAAGATGGEIFTTSPRNRNGSALVSCSSPAAEVMRYGMALLAGFVARQPSLLDVVLRFPGLKGCLVFGLVRAAVPAVREEVATGLLRMSTELGGAQERCRAASRFRETLLLALPEADAHPEFSEDYFALLSQLVARPGGLPEAPLALCAELATFVARRPVVEASDEDRDPALSGCMQLLLSTITSLPPELQTPAKFSLGEAGLLHHVFQVCLFAPPPRRHTGVEQDEPVAAAAAAALDGSPRPPKCKHADSRRLAFALLTELSTSCPQNLGILVALALPHHHLGLTEEEQLRRLARGGGRHSDLGNDKHTSTDSMLLSTDGRTTSAQWAAARDGGRNADVGDHVGSGQLLHVSSFGVQPRHVSKHRSGYAGLKNPGCICYMNSTLQQLFMIPEFRRDVLACGTEAEAGRLAAACGGIAAAAAGSGSDSAGRDRGPLVFQLQRLFAHMQESDKCALSTRDFCEALRGWDGGPTDVNVQQDASEFAALFFQQIEAAVQGTASAGLMQRSFGGVLAHELSTACGRRSERTEPYCVVSVKVKDMDSLEKSFEHYIKGEVVDYTWEEEPESFYSRLPPLGEAGVSDVTADAEKAPPTLPATPPPRLRRSLPTVKSAAFKTLPPHLVLHLQRFEFDFQTMQQNKVNDRFSFPLMLDMYPYTQDARRKAEKAAAAVAADDATGTPLTGATADNGKASRVPGDARGPDGEREAAAAGGNGGIAAEAVAVGVLRPDNCLYELAGIIVHMGTANSGHYYTYTRERGGCRRWLEFNDAMVADFDPASLEQECFGGIDADGGPTAARQRRASNLLHSIEGRHSSQLPTRAIKWSGERARNAFMLFYDRIPVTDGVDGSVNGDVSIAVARGRPRVPVPDTIMQEIWLENLEFFRKQWVFEPAYYNFVGGLLNESLTVITAEQQQRQRRQQPDAGNDNGDARSDGCSQVVLAIGKDLSWPGDTVRLGVRFGLGTLVQAGELRLLRECCTRQVAKLLRLLPEECDALLCSLAVDAPSLREVLVGSEDTATRAAVTAAIADAMHVSIAAMGEGKAEAYASALRRWWDASPAPGGEGAEADGGGGGELDETVPAALRLMHAALLALPALRAEDDVLRASTLLELVASFVEAGPAETSYFLGVGGLGCLASFLLGDASPYPELLHLRCGAAATSPALRVRAPPPPPSRPPQQRRSSEMHAGDEMRKADTRGLIRTLSTLLRACNVSSYPDVSKPPALPREEKSYPATGAGSGAAEQLVVGLPLRYVPSPAEESMLTSPGFIHAIVAQLSSPVRRCELTPLLHHLCRDNRPLTNLFCNAVLAGIMDYYDGFELKPFFRAVAALAILRDSLTVWRISHAMNKLMGGMEEQANHYIRATEMAIEMTVRLAKNSAGVRAWLGCSENREACKWMINWLEARVVCKVPVPPGCPTPAVYKPLLQRPNGEVLYRTHRQDVALPSVGALGKLSRVTLEGTALFPDWALVTLSNIRALMAGKSMPERGYDSDDEPEELVDRKVEVRWAECYYGGMIMGYDAASGNHSIQYFDGEEREYDLAEKRWRLPDAQGKG